MKIKKEKVIGTRRTVLYILTQKDSYRLHEAARFLKGNEWLVPYHYEVKGKKYYVRFDVTGLVPLDFFLSQPLRTPQFIELLSGIDCFLHSRAQIGVPIRDVRFASHEVYVNVRDGHLKFVFVPTSQSNTSSRDVYDLIYFVAQHSCLSDAAVCGFVREQLLQFLAVPELFSVTEFRKFVTSFQRHVQGERKLSIASQGISSISENSFAHLAREYQPMVPQSLESDSVTAIYIVRALTGDFISLTTFPFRIGSDKSNDYVISNNGAISKEHAMITQGEHTLCIIDLHSTNGTWVANQKLLPGQVEELQLGKPFVLANEEFWLLTQENT